MYLLSSGLVDAPLGFFARFIHDGLKLFRQSLAFAWDYHDLWTSSLRKLLYLQALMQPISKATICVQGYCDGPDGVLSALAVMVSSSMSKMDHLHW